jgi:citrate synthase
MKKPFSKGLEGVVATQSSLSHVDGKKGTLVYRGYDIYDLAKHATFEEVIYLLWYGSLPTESSLARFSHALKKEMALPRGLKKVIVGMPQKTAPMAGLRTCISWLGAYDTHCEDISEKANKKRALSIMAKMPSCIAALYRTQHKKTIISPKNKLSIAGNFLYMLKGKTPTSEEEKIMDVCLILHAEHGLNASTFAGRVTVSTLSDMYSGVVSAIGTLKGPLHGGANRRAIQALHYLGDSLKITDACTGSCLNHVDNYVYALLKEHKRIMGIGHRVYKVKDPRANILEQYAKNVVDHKKDYQMAKQIEKVMAKEKKLYPNVDFFSGIVYEHLGIPPSLYVCIFALSRTSGWLAHILEQYADNRLIRPRLQYIGERTKRYVPLGRRR